MQFHDRLLLLAFTLSGAAGLGYELVWTRLLSLALGSESLGLLATLGGFFGGMAIGSAVLHHRVERALDPVRAFVLLELTAAGFALVSPYLLYALSEALPQLLGPTPPGGLLLAIATLALLPGTFCLGATLPALVAAYRRTRADQVPRGLSRLYAVNTVGATIGTLAAVYVLMPTLGLASTASAFALCGAAAGALALRWSKQHPELRELPVATTEPQLLDCSRDPDPDLLREGWLLYTVAGTTGLLGVGLEVVGVTVLSQNFENTIYTFANTLAVYLVGTACGAALFGRISAKIGRGRPGTLLVCLLALLALATILAAIALRHSPAIIAVVHPEAGGSLATGIAGEMLATLAVFGLPTLLMGALFSHVIGLLSLRDGAGRAYAINTLGGALAPAVCGVWAIDALGYADSIYALAYAYLLIFVACAWMRRFSPVMIGGGVIAVVAATALGPRSLALVQPGKHWQQLSQVESRAGVVTVSEFTGPRPEGAPVLRRLQVGHQFRMGGALSFGERRMGHLSVLLRPNPSSVLVLGVGTGATAGAALQLAGPKVQLDAVELVPAVVDALPLFSEVNHQLHTAAGAQVHIADARRFVSASNTERDLIIADLFHPARDGAGSLYAREHFEAIRAHLRPGGVFVQWLPLHQLSPQDLKTIVRTFLSAFAEAHAFLGLYNARTPSLALVGVASDGTKPGLSLELAQLNAMVQQPGMTIVEVRDLLASYFLDYEGLAEFAGAGPLHTDLEPRITFDAPHTAYADNRHLGAQNLADLVRVRRAFPRQLIAGSDTEAIKSLQAQVHAYAAALSSYLLSQIEVSKTTPPDPTVAKDLLLEAYRHDPEFPAARGALYRLAASHPELAVDIFEPMLARTPRDTRLLQTYLVHLQTHATPEQAAAFIARIEANAPAPQ